MSVSAVMYPSRGVHGRSIPKIQVSRPKMCVGATEREVRSRIVAMLWAKCASKHRLFSATT